MRRLVRYEPDLFDLIKYFVVDTILTDGKIHSCHRDLHKYVRNHMYTSGNINGSLQMIWTSMESVYAREKCVSWDTGMSYRMLFVVSRYNYILSSQKHVTVETQTLRREIRQTTKHLYFKSVTLPYL